MLLQLWKEAELARPIKWVKLKRFVCLTEKGNSELMLPKKKKKRKPYRISETLQHAKNTCTVTILIL